jgi:hypothetical protein
VRIPLTPGYVAKGVTIYDTKIDLSIPLTDRPHQLITEFTVVGNLTNFKDPALLGRATLWYSFETAHKTVTFCSNDLVSSDSMYLTTIPRGSATQYCHQHTYYFDNRRREERRN